nr:MAG TPA: hypothetical protein [Caudoviricetes sp.]
MVIYRELYQVQTHAEQSTSRRQRAARIGKGTSQRGCGPKVGERAASVSKKIKKFTSKFRGCK